MNEIRLKINVLKDENGNKIKWVSETFVFLELGHKVGVQRNKQTLSTKCEGTQVGGQDVEPNQTPPQKNRQKLKHTTNLQNSVGKREFL